MFYGRHRDIIPEQARAMSDEYTSEPNMADASRQTGLANCVTLLHRKQGSQRFLGGLFLSFMGALFVTGEIASMGFHLCSVLVTKLYCPQLHFTPVDDMLTLREQVMVISAFTQAAPRVTLSKDHAGEINICANDMRILQAECPIAGARRLRSGFRSRNRRKQMWRRP